MQKFDQWLQANAFGVTVDAGVIPAGGVAVHQSYGTTGASYSPEVGNPNGYFYPTVFQTDLNQNVNVIAQGVAIPMGSQIQRGGRLSAYDALGCYGQRVGAGGSGG